MSERTDPATLDCDPQPQGSQPGPEGKIWFDPATPYSKCAPEPEEKIWFDGVWLDALLSCEKQQTTRKQTDRIKVGDTVPVYNHKYRAIHDKPLRTMTATGSKMFMADYPFVNTNNTPPKYHAHFLGKVVITEVYDIIPSEMSGEELEAWAWADGFDSIDVARCWFEIRYGTRWMHKTWTAICWRGWAERYFEPEVEAEDR